MSRRITVFVLAASTALIATQASADRECFEDSCNLTAEQPAEAVPPVEKTTVTEAPSPALASQAAAPDVASREEQPASTRAELVKSEAVKVEATRAESPKAETASAEPVAKPLKIETVNAEPADKEQAPSVAQAKAVMPVATLEPPKPVMPVIKVEVAKPTAAQPAKIEVVRTLTPVTERPRVVAAEPSRSSVAMTPSPVEREPVRLVRHYAVAQRAESKPVQPKYIEPRRTEEARTRVTSYVQAETPAAAYTVVGPAVAAPVVVAVPGVIYPVYGARQIYMLAPNAKIISIDR